MSQPPAPAAAPEPDVSIVVATHNRAALLPRLFRAIARQDGIATAELIVVDDGSRDDTGRVLEHLARDATFPVTVLRLPESRGPGGARNAGWVHARAPLVMFTDDDCEPQPGWLRGLVGALAHADVVQGRTRPAPDQLPALGPFGRTINVPTENGYFQTCNVGYRRVMLAALDGFDDAFRLVGEDTDLALRAIESGAQTVFCPDAVVHHDVRPSNWWVHVRTSWRWRGLPLVLKRHPNVRARLVHRFFWKPSHPPAIVALLGVALAVLGRSRPAKVTGAAMGLAYVDYRVRRAPLTDDPLHRVGLLPAALVADINEVAVIATGAVRHRAPML